MYRYKVFFILIFIYIGQINAAAMSRQKRCIVIQKQSGTHGDTNEGQYDDYKSNGRFYGEKNHLKEVEPMTSEYLRYNLLPTNKFVDSLRNKLKTFKF